MKISVILIVKNDSIALWHTFNSIYTKLQNYDFEIIIVDDSSEDFVLQEYFNRPNFDKRVKYHRVSFDSTSSSRNYGASLTDGGIILFLDAHVILGEDSISKIIKFFKHHKDATIGFIPLIRYPGSDKVSHHKIHWDTDWWFDWLSPKEKPFRCASGGHGAYIIRKECWDKIGGYPSELVGYGSSAEEIYINILNWMYNGECWVITDVYQIHNDFGRNYKQQLSKMQVNHIISSYLIGGKKYSDYVKNSYVTDMDKDLYTKIIDSLSEKREKIDKLGINLDNLIDKFNKEHIDY